MKLLKILLYGFGGLVLLLVVAGVAATLFVEPNQFKPQIVKAVKDQTGRDLDIQGDLALSVFPWLGVKIGPTRMSNPEGFGDQPFAQVEEVDVRVKLMPLIERKVQADTVSLSGLQLALVRDAQGRGNWEDLIAAKSATAEPADTASSAAGDGIALAGLVIDGIAISDALISLDDQQSGQRLAIRNLNLETGAVDLNRPLPIEARFEIDSNAPALTGQVSVDGTVNMDLSQQRYRFGEGKIAFNLAGAAIPGDALEGKLDMDLSADLISQIFGLSDGGFEFTLTGPDLPGGKVAGAFDFQAEADLEAQTAKVSRFDGTLMGLALSAALDVTQLNDNPQVKGQLNLAEFSPRAWLPTLALPLPDTSDPAVLTRVSFQTGLTATSERAVLDGLQMVLDDTTLTGGAEVSNFSRPAVRFDLTADAIDLDRYMAPSTDTTVVADSGGTVDGAATPAETAAPSAAAPVPVGLPLDTLRELDLIGKARVGRLTVSNLNVSDAQLRLEAKGGLIQLNPISVSLYQGVAKGRMAMDVRANQPALSSTMNVVNVQAEPLLKDLQGEALLAGRGQVALDLTATGLTSDSLKRSLNGNVGIKFLDGAVMGVNVAQIIREAQAALSGQPLNQSRAPNRTDFAELSGTANIVNGTLTNQDLALKSPLLRIQGSGSVTLPTETIDYLIRASVVESLEGQGGQGLADLRGVTIPVRVSGTFSQPSYQPDVEAVLTEIAKAKAQEELEKRQDELQAKGMEKLKKQLGDQLGGDVGEKLKGLFK